MRKFVTNLNVRFFRHFELASYLFYFQSVISQKQVIFTPKKRAFPCPLTIVYIFLIYNHLHHLHSSSA